MCYAAAIMAAVQIGGSLISSGMQNKASAKALKQNAQNEIRQYGTTMSNLNIKAIDEAMDYRQQMTSNEFARYQTMGNINQQIQEGGIKGRSMRRTSALADAQFTRHNAELTMNYEKAYANIQNEKMNEYLGVTARLKGIKSKAEAQTKAMNSKLAMVTGISTGKVGSSFVGTLYGKNAGVEQLSSLFKQLVKK